MATHSRLRRSVLISSLLLSGCVTHVPTACVGDAQALGYHDGALGQRLCVGATTGDAGVAYESGWNEGIRRFCTEEQGYRQGGQGAAISTACPDTLATRYLDGYQAGYVVYLTQLEVDAMERSIEAKSAELENVWSKLHALASHLEQRDIDSASRTRWLAESRTLMTRQTEIGAEIDELESEVGARKAQLTQLRHAIAVSD
jgi:hypothetical protein